MPGIVRLIALLMAGFVATAGAAAANQWKVYRYPQEGFAAEFPGPPKFTTQKAPHELFVRDVQQLATDDAGTAFMGQTMIYQPSVRKNHTADQILRASIDGARDAIKCSIRSERNYSFPGAIAREVVFENCEGDFAGKSRFFLVGATVYYVVAIGKSGVEKTADADRFVDSFSLIGR